jgi:chromosome segregation ATPase
VDRHEQRDRYALRDELALTHWRYRRHLRTVKAAFDSLMATHTDLLATYAAALGRAEQAERERDALRQDYNDLLAERDALQFAATQVARERDALKQQLQNLEGEL